MTQQDIKSQPSKNQTRQDRLSKALRENLLKRKQQQRHRKEETPENAPHMIDIKGE